MNILKAFGLKKAPKGSNRQPYPRLDRDTIMEGWGPEGMSEEERREMEGRDESFGDYVERTSNERATRQDDEWRKKFAAEGHTIPERFARGTLDEALDREQMDAGEEDWARDWSEHFAGQQGERGEGIPIKGRQETAKQKSERLHQKVERPQSHSAASTTLANLREGQTPSGSRGRSRIGISPEAQSSAGGGYRKPKRVAEALKMLGF